jgi:hypothetical protein
MLLNKFIQEVIVSFARIIIIFWYYWEIAKSSLNNLNRGIIVLNSKFWAKNDSLKLKLIQTIQQLVDKPNQYTVD